MDHDFGKRLIQARLARGVTVEEAAHALRMRPGMVRSLEDSNLLQFPNAAYAKSFLLMYAKYLGIDMAGVAGTIDTTTQMRVEDFQYLTNLATDEKKQQREASDPRYDFVVARKPGGSWLPLFLVLAVAAIGVAVFIFVNNLHRFDTSKPTPAPQTASAPATKPAVPPTPAPAVAQTPPTPAETPTLPSAPGVPGVPTSPDGTHNATTQSSAVVAVPTPTPSPLIGGNNSPAVPPEVPAGPEEETSGPTLPAGTVVLEPVRKTWVVIRNGPGGQPLYEDYLYPTAKPMHLPAGKYFIELRDADGVEISKDGKTIAYSAPGVLID